MYKYNICEGCTRWREGVLCWPRNFFAILSGHPWVNRCGGNLYWRNHKIIVNLFDYTVNCCHSWQFIIEWKLGRQFQRHLGWCDQRIKEPTKRLTSWKYLGLCSYCCRIIPMLCLAGLKESNSAGLNPRLRILISLEGKPTVWPLLLGDSELPTAEGAVQPIDKPTVD